MKTMFKWGALDTPNSGWTVQNIFENQRRDKTQDTFVILSKWIFQFWQNQMDAISTNSVS